MLGITLSAEQIRAAPSEVRLWLQREIASSLDFPREAEAPGVIPPHVVSCEPEEALAIFAAIREMPAAANVFFELGREGEIAASADVSVHKLVDMTRRARLQTVEQLEASLQLINQAVRAVKNDQGATLYVVDPRGYCVTARATQKSILEVWRRIVASQSLASAPVATMREPTFAAPRSDFPEINAVVPQDRVHMDDVAPIGAA